ncbi:hypothetical protein N5J30_04145 [Klebsiella michiganensis]|uniref:hypothetical protein n=1 Tax=Klebsiella/Raoultella group TaxID=2890311 RepID=UPI001C7D9682|nr:MULTISPECIES: hypothetical protein [Klebsiella/Raoultella group]HBR0921571.1 hypothetical protein [Klebsiella quasipneumoniae subsp. quasipneumoniae]MDD9638928.1 hypothetical protein [Klebsiella michiganensis]MDH1969858.1 hypothetical protein [Klebsiella michiganensis]MDM4218335.1 hypothetical protein [Klebsiella pasteurii]HBR1352325.1 hypothetical protein [Klebsiella quasipneumoniae subsp. quasipneumoniae]
MTTKRELELELELAVTRKQVVVLSIHKMQSDLPLLDKEIVHWQEQLQELNIKEDLDKGSETDGES